MGLETNDQPSSWRFQWRDNIGMLYVREGTQGYCCLNHIRGRLGCFSLFNVDPFLTSVTRREDSTCIVLRMSFSTWFWCSGAVGPTVKASGWVEINLNPLPLPMSDELTQLSAKHITRSYRSAQLPTTVDKLY